MPAIQFKRRVTGAIAPVPTPAVEGEPHFSVPGFTGGGPNALWIDTGTAVVPLIDRTRQVELAGAQTITGPKTFEAAVTFAGTMTATLIDAVDDAAAATAGVKVDEFYVNGSQVMRRRV